MDNTAAGEAPLNVRIENRAARLTFYRPGKLNAVNGELRRALADALEDAARNPEVRAVVLAGAGRAFCAGQDLGELKDRETPEPARATEYLRLYNAIRNCPKPVIARLHGHVAGAGLQMALLCDLRIAGQSARIGMTEFNVGLPVFIGSGLLKAVVGEAAMKRIILYSDFVSGDEALHLNLVTQVVPDEALDARIDDIVSGLAARDPEAVRLTKECWAALSDADYRGIMEYAHRMRGAPAPQWDD